MVIQATVGSVRAKGIILLGVRELLLFDRSPLNDLLLWVCVIDSDFAIKEVCISATWRKFRLELLYRIWLWLLLKRNRLDLFIR